MQRKKCRECDNPVWSKGLCKYHDALANPEKYSIKKSLLSSKKVKHIKPISEKQAKRLAKYRGVRDSFLKDHCVCEFPNCTSTEVECHHGAGKVGDKLTDVRYFKALCRVHHIWVETHPLESKEMGLSYDRL